MDNMMMNALYLAAQQQSQQKASTGSQQPSLAQMQQFMTQMTVPNNMSKTQNSASQNPNDLVMMMMLKQKLLQEEMMRQAMLKKMQQAAQMDAFYKQLQMTALQSQMSSAGFPANMLGFVSDQQSDYNSYEEIVKKQRLSQNGVNNDSVISDNSSQSTTASDPSLAYIMSAYQSGLSAQQQSFGTQAKSNGSFVQPGNNHGANSIEDQIKKFAVISSKLMNESSLTTPDFIADKKAHMPQAKKNGSKTSPKAKN